MERGNETILLVEDEPSVRDVISRIMETLGYEVVRARNGTEALALLQCENQPVHLVVTDVLMPDMDGLQLIAKLRVTRPDLRVLFISGHTEDILVDRGFGADQYPLLQKPFSPAVLAKRLREVLDRQPASK